MQVATDHAGRRTNIGTQYYFSVVMRRILGMTTSSRSSFHSVNIQIGVPAVLVVVPPVRRTTGAVSGGLSLAEDALHPVPTNERACFLSQLAVGLETRSRESIRVETNRRADRALLFPFRSYRSPSCGF